MGKVRSATLRYVEYGLATVLLFVAIAFWSNRLVEGGVLLFAAGWCFVRIYFERERWAFYLVIALLLLLQAFAIGLSPK